MIILKKYMKFVKSGSLRVINEGYFTDGEKVLVHQFNRDWIKLIVTEDVKKGNYRIGVFEEGSYNVCYVGRATDQTLQERMLQHSEYEDDRYYFFFEGAETDDEAIEQECIDYHSFGGDDGYLDNDYHPALPEGKECPWNNCDHVGRE